MDIKLTATLTKNNKTMSKQELTKLNGKNSAYVLIRNGTVLDNAPKDAAAGGWQKVNGLASQRSSGGVPDHDNIAFVSTDKTNHAQVVAITANRVITDGFADPSDRLSGYIRHETTHLFY